MSRAFVSEEAAAREAALLPERPVPAGPNPVTPRGLGLIEAARDRLEARHATTSPDDPARPAIDRDLRYWRARLATARVVPPAAAPDEVVFGSRVTLVRADGTRVSYRIVGEDEADPPAGLLGWTAPLATALLGARPGETIEPPGGRPAVTVAAID